ncbi:rhomboid family intramembrane serine protease [Candidatus Bathyarchaeota archaeon]|nr:rhomboid family intramembrane serine protease [Candidatus Bathyarchaeota archaeon]
MIPIGDDNSSRITPYVNLGLIAANILVFLWQYSSTLGHFQYTLYMYGLVPQVVLRGEHLYTFATNMFLHGGWSHLLGNMLFLMIFGDNVEDRLGHARYLAFYLISGVAASTLWLVTALDSIYPAVGASGAISGVLGAYFVLFPGTRIRALMTAGFFLRVVRVPAWMMIGLWFVYQLVLAVLPLNTGVAYWAHVGGFVFGLVFARLFRPRENTWQRY